MITVETRGLNPQKRTFTSAHKAKCFVVDCQMGGDCTIIKYTEGGRTNTLKLVDGHWILTSHFGKTGVRRADGRCSECGYSNFAYSNGSEFSEDGVRGYRCVRCKTIKPEAG